LCPAANYLSLTSLSETLARHSPSLARSLSFSYKHKCIKCVCVYMKQEKIIYIHIFLFPSPRDLACQSPRSRSPPSPLSLIQIETKCIKCGAKKLYIYTCKYIYFRSIHLKLYNTHIFLPSFLLFFLSFSFYTHTNYTIDILYTTAFFFTCIANYTTAFFDNTSAFFYICIAKYTYLWLLWSAIMQIIAIIVFVCYI